MSFAELLDLNGWRPDDTLTLNRLEGGQWQTRVVTVDKAPLIVDQHLASRDAWYSVCPLRSDFEPYIIEPDGRRRRARGSESDVVGLRALWTDLDVGKAAGKSLPSMDAALDLINVLSEHLGVRPSTQVASGHGIHPYWIIEDGVDWEPGDVDAIAEAKKILTDWGHLVQQEARRLGGEVDSVHDLARVMRIPGTANMKGSA